MAPIRLRPPGALLVFALGLGVGLGLACDGGEDCPDGREGCPCTADGLCLEGLSCLSSYCVDPNWTPPDGTPADDGDDDGGVFDNVAACNEALDAIACGDVDLTMYVDCGVYADYACDVADYFDCITENVACTDGVVDASHIADCANLATCA